MTEHELFQKTFSTLHASPDTLMEVQKTMENSKKTHRTLRRGVVIAIAAALTLTVAAATGVVTLIKANVSPADKVDDTTYHAFTDDMDASTPTVEGNSGELITLPDMERIPGDRDTVQRLVGDYLSKLDAQLTVGSTTITLETFLVDESGCGILTYTVDDPEGVSYEDAGYGEVYSLPLQPRMYLRSPDYQQGGSINVKLHVDKTTSTATHLDVVAYFAAGETYQKGDNFYFTVYDGGGEGREPYAVVQLRKDNADGSIYNLVGFQTHLKWPEQRRVFTMIPALKNAQFLRYGVMHRNTYLDSPRLLDRYYRLKTQPRLVFAGQMTGVEGYVESCASGFLAGVEMARRLKGQPPLDFPRETAIGALGLYVSNESVGAFQPMNINFGIIPPLDHRVKGKRNKNAELSARSLQIIDQMREEVLT